MVQTRKIEGQKITLGTTTKKTPSTIMAAATTIAPLLAGLSQIWLEHLDITAYTIQLQ